MLIVRSLALFLALFHVKQSNEKSRAISQLDGFAMSVLDKVCRCKNNKKNQYIYGTFNFNIETEYVSALNEIVKSIGK